MRLLLAPMEGVIDHNMRALLSALGGLDRCVTEFLRVSGQLLPPRVFYRICPELRSGSRTPSGVPVFLQLLGGQPVPVAENAARAAELGAAGVDLNFGCPAKTVNRSDGGAIVLREPERVHAIVAAVRRALPAATPLSVKIRLGFDSRDTLQDVVDGVAAGGAGELVIHARTRVDGYRPPAYWDAIAAVRERVHIPVIANGDIWHPEDALRCRQQSHCNDLMLGRGVLCRPDLPRLVQASSSGETLAPLNWSGVLPLLTQLLEANRRCYDARHVVNPIKQWLNYLRHYYPQAGLLFEQVKRLREADALQAALLAQVDGPAGTSSFAMLP